MSELHVCSINMVEYLEFSPAIREIMKKNAEITIIKNKAIALLWALKYAPTHGVIAEFGCYKGGNGFLFSQMRPSQSVYLFDTFTGTPDKIMPDIDDHKAGEYADCSLDKVKETFKNINNVHIIPGEFETSLPNLKGKNFSLAFIDADLYLSTKQVLSHVKQRMLPGGIIVLDDYSQADCRGVKKAVHEELPLTELLMLMNGSLVAWQNLGCEVSACQDQSPPLSDSQDP